MNRTEFIGTNLYYSQEFVDDLYKEIEKLKEPSKKEIEINFKEVLDKIKEYITTIDTDYAIGCWNKEGKFVDVKKDILELLEEIE